MRVTARIGILQLQFALEFAWCYLEFVIFKNHIARSQSYFIPEKGTLNHLDAWEMQRYHNESKCCCHFFRLFTLRSPVWGLDLQLRNWMRIFSYVINLTTFVIQVKDCEWSQGANPHIYNQFLKNLGKHQMISMFLKRLFRHILRRIFWYCLKWMLYS